MNRCITERNQKKIVRARDYALQEYGRTSVRVCAWIHVHGAQRTDGHTRVSAGRRRTAAPHERATEEHADETRFIRYFLSRTLHTHTTDGRHSREQLDDGNNGQQKKQNINRNAIGVRAFTYDGWRLFGHTSGVRMRVYVCE
uniref:Uncharacterized protein n=1 Tax=Sipha flava TaxID=143950 RepID=A0A2S2QCL3_9HEMI